MPSIATEPPTLRSIPLIGAVTSSSAAAANRRSYSCYNCNYSFHITPTPTTSASSPSSFRCPRCHHRHLIPYHTISPPPPPPSHPPPPPPPPENSDYVSGSSIFTYQSSDESDSDYEYDSENSLLSFAAPELNRSTPALKSFVDSLPIKMFLPNSAPSLQSCSICMEEFGINPDSFVTINELPCQHYFHKDCIVEWFQRSNTCPLCRYKLPVDPSQEQAIDSGSIRWEAEYESYNAIFVVDLAPIREPFLRRVSAEESLSSIATSSGSDRRVMDANGGERSGVDFDAMHDEDGDTLMVDA
ncbi:hypothetical protein BUALT_Bualt13G0029600 [Buddleja alternifolia]|uniref:RING-type E3 ubiquitin transferase n=1 Tax=Buddleja alternifolia TaxID=168488 RepID=A0AAV6WRG3_9LAMI|nr:hypothetical protein BUALT_Bualt13G0029600 [Buddleja alternifolia]